MRRRLATVPAASTWSRWPVCEMRQTGITDRQRPVANPRSRGAAGIPIVIRLRASSSAQFVASKSRLVGVGGTTFLSRASGVALVLVLGLTAVQGQMSLVEAVKAGNMTAARALLAKKADVNAAAADGSTALHWAVEHDDLEVAGALLAAGARARVANRYGVTPLHVAATNGNARM